MIKGIIVKIQVLLFVLFNLYSINANANLKDISDDINQGVRKDTYNLDNVPKKRGFSAMSKEQREQAFVSQLLSNKRKNLKWYYGKRIPRDLAYGGIAAASAIAALYWGFTNQDGLLRPFTFLKNAFFENGSEEQQLLGKSCIVAPVGIFVFNQLNLDFSYFKDPKGNIDHSLGGFLNISRGNYFDPLEELEISFAKKYMLLPVEAKKHIVDQFISYRKNPSEFKRVHDYVSIALKMPIVESSTRFDYKAFDNDVSIYPQEVQDRLKLVAFRSDLLNSNSKNAHLIPQFPAYLLGPPGVGKTRAIKSMASAKNTPFGFLNLDGVDSDGLLGTIKTPGRLLEAISGAVKDINEVNTVDMVLFVDEFDRALKGNIIPILLKLMDPDRKDFYSPYLGYSITLPRNIVLAGNSPVEDEALVSRLDVIELPAYTQEQKRKIAIESIIPRIMRGYGIKKSVLENPLVMRDLEEIIKNTSPEAPGVRRIELEVERYFEQYLMDGNPRL